MAGYVYRGSKFDWAALSVDETAEWARYLTKNERARQAYDELRSREVIVWYAPAPKRTEGVRSGTPERVETRRAARAYHKARTRSKSIAA